MTPPSKDILEFIRDCGIDVSQRDLTVLQRLGDHLVRANEQMNLTTLTDAGDYWLRHIADSLAIGRVLPDLLHQPLTVADVGCGPGFPLLPLAWANPAGRWVGLEATGKKAAFVCDQIAELPLPHVEVYHIQAREAAREEGLAGVFDAVVFRAVNTTGRLIRDARNLLSPDAPGRLIAYKTPDAVAEERAVTRREADKYGFEVIETPPLQLPGNAGLRQFVICRRNAG